MPVNEPSGEEKKCTGTHHAATDEGGLAVEFAAEDRMNLLGFFLRSVIGRAAKEPSLRKHLSRLKGVVELGASSMKVFVEPTHGRIVISTDPPEKPAARVWGSLDTMLEVATGGGIIRAVAGGRLRIAGKVWRLLPLLFVFKGVSR